MKTHLLKSIAILSLLCLFSGCHGGDASSSSATQPSVAEGPVTQPSVPIPPDSIFAKVKVGMSQDQVFATIGQPTSLDRYQTGKAWIPFHFSGSDDARSTAHYKGVGTITFSLDSAYSSSFSVISIDYDPSEPGFAK
jgi:hypothetical protein